MFDYIIIGAGPGGLGLAYRLKTKDNKIAMIENDKWGGTCPNYGCDPTKMMMAVIEAKSHVEHLKGQGISGDLKIDWKGLRSRKLNITDPYEKSTFEGLKNADIETIYGSASFTEQGELQVAGEIYQAKTYIIAAGSRPRRLELDGDEFLKTSNDFLALEELPAKISFMGSGPISLELAQIAKAAGSDVTIISRKKSNVAHFDEEMGQEFINYLKNQGINFIENISVNKVEKFTDGFLLTDGAGFEHKTDLVIAGVGRQPNSDQLNLDKVGVETDHKGIKVNDYLQTSNPKIYAMGDVLSKAEPHLTPVSSFEGNYLGQNLPNANKVPIHYPQIPTIIFGTAKLAEVGILTGTGIRTKSLNLKSWYTYKRINDPLAKLKVAINENQEIVGASTVSSVADEVINLISILIQQKMTLADVEKMIFTYPTVASDLEYFY